jgi:hypothetical protein
LFLADVKTGMAFRPYSPETDAEMNNDLILPQIIPANALNLSLAAAPYGNSVHYLEYNNFIIVSLHALKGGQLTQWLYIFDCINPNSYREVYVDLLNSDIQKIQPEAFILHKSRLIYIKNKSELKVLCL